MRTAAPRLALLLVFGLASPQMVHSATPSTTNAVLGWGGNDYGQFGDGTKVNQTLPKDSGLMGALSGKAVTQISTGIAHGVALCSDGTVASWGYNSAGQLGNGTSSESGQTLPGAINNNGALKGKRVIRIAAGYTHTLTLCNDGTVAAWGSNAGGQLGDGTLTNRTVPVSLALQGALKGKLVTQIAAGGSQSVALCSDGTIVYWGNASYQGLGSPNLAIPTAFNNQGALVGKKVTRLAAGNLHTLTLCSDGSLVAWGFNNRGQLGNGTTNQSGTPVVVTPTNALKGKTIIQISAGYNHNLALCSDGTLVGWGANEAGQMGSGSTNDQLIPYSISGQGALAGKTVSQIASGCFHNFALCTDGTLVAWGRGTAGQLGDGAIVNRLRPVNITTKGTLYNKKPFQLVGGFNHSLALATAPTDTQKPEVTVYSPLAGQSLPIGTFSGDTIRGSASDVGGVASVTIKLYRNRGGVNQIWNGTAFTTTSTTVPADVSGTNQSVQWKIGTKAPLQSQLDLGPYTVAVYATDAAGNTTAIQTNFTLTNPDTQKPVVSISTPSANQTISLLKFSAYSIRGYVSDNVGVSKVEFKLYRTRGGVNQIWNGTDFTTTSTTVLTTPSSSRDPFYWNMGTKAPPPELLDEGPYSVIVYATDPSENLASVRTNFNLSLTATIAAPISGGSAGDS